jgi:hypothetical protein
MNTGKLYNGWPNRPTWVLVCWLHAYRYCYSMDATLAFWQTAENTFDRSGRALKAMAERGWSAQNDEWLRTLPATEVAKWTCRMMKAVWSRRRTLGLPDARKAKAGVVGRLASAR